MSNTTNLNMSKEEILSKYLEIKEQLAEIEKLYIPHIGRRIDSMTLEESTMIRELIDLAKSLTIAKKDLGQIITVKYGIFVI